MTPFYNKKRKVLSEFIQNFLSYGVYRQNGMHTSKNVIFQAELIVKKFISVDNYCRVSTHQNPFKMSSNSALGAFFLLSLGFLHHRSHPSVSSIKDEPAR